MYDSAEYSGWSSSDTTVRTQVIPSTSDHFDTWSSQIWLCSRGDNFSYRSIGWGNIAWENSMGFTSPVSVDYGFGQTIVSTGSGSKHSVRRCCICAHVQLVACDQIGML